MGFDWKGATTPSITTFSVMTLGITPFSITVKKSHSASSETMLTVVFSLLC